VQEQARLAAQASAEVVRARIGTVLWLSWRPRGQSSNTCMTYLITTDTVGLLPHRPDLPKTLRVSLILL
jgi:hypothetical protein